MGRIVANCVPRAQGRCLLFLLPEKSENTEEDKKVNNSKPWHLAYWGRRSSRGRLMGVLSGSVRREVAPLYLQQ